MQTDVSKWNFGRMGSFFGLDLLDKDKNSYKIGSRRSESVNIRFEEKSTILMITFLVLLLRLFAVVLVASLPGSCE